MLKREALRELQGRLASRLQAVRAQGVAAAWLAVRVGQQPCLLPLAQSGEIFPWAPVQPVPYTQDWFLGVANLRGGLFGVVDLARYLTPTPTPVRREVRDNDIRLVVFNEALDVNCALLIDQLIGLRHAEAFVSAIPAEASGEAHWGATFTDAQGTNWREINMQALAHQQPFLSIVNTPLS